MIIKNAVAIPLLIAVSAGLIWYLCPSSCVIDMDSSDAARSTLKSRIFPCEISYQSGAYSDSNKNGTGEFGMMEDIIKLQPEFTFDEKPGKHEKHGSAFEIVLPATAEEREKNFTAFAWSTIGRYDFILAIAQDGRIRTRKKDQVTDLKSENVLLWDILEGGRTLPPK
jgi:hypothetical protein